jgi:hypothetical protein
MIPASNMKVLSLYLVKEMSRVKVFATDRQKKIVHPESSILVA